jgi:hypothetical protein
VKSLDSSNNGPEKAESVTTTYVNGLIRLRLEIGEIDPAFRELVDLRPEASRHVRKAEGSAPITSMSTPTCSTGCTART